MSKRILVLAEDWALEGDAVRYALALARRIDGEIVLLLLLSLDLDPARDADALRRRGEDFLRSRALVPGGSNVAVDLNVRAGDAWSEFCKFVATKAPVHMVVWAGESHPPNRQQGWFAGHWISRVQEELGCPVVVAQRR